MPVEEGGREGGREGLVMTRRRRAASFEMKAKKEEEGNYTQSCPSLAINLPTPS